MRAEFEKVIAARDTLLRGQQKDIIFRGAKIKVTGKGKLLAGETVSPTGVVKKAEPIIKAVKKPAIPEVVEIAAQKLNREGVLSLTKEEFESYLNNFQKHPQYWIPKSMNNYMSDRPPDNSILY